MFDYLQKFNSLPQNLRDSVSSPAAMTVISDLEKKYKIDLAAIVMKVMVKAIPLGDLPTIFVSDFLLNQENAKKLTAELKEKLFFMVANYLGYIASYSSVIPKIAPVSEISLPERIVKEAGIIFAGMDLNQRLKSTLNTYLKGIRSRIDTRITLNKEIISGGLGLDHKVIDKIFDISDKLVAPLPTIAPKTTPTIELPKAGLEKVRALYEKAASARDIPYDLTAAIAKGEVKKPVSPINLPIPEERQEKMLAEPAEELMIKGPMLETTNSKFIVPAIINKENNSVAQIPVSAEAKTRFTSEIKSQIISEESSRIPEIKTRFISEIKIPTAPVASVVPVAPVVSEIKIPKPISTPISAIPAVAAATVSSGLSAITPIAPAKIIKPAEKVSMWSKLFKNKVVVQKEVKPLPKPITPPLRPTIAPASIPVPSVAARRMEAAATTFKTEAPKIPTAIPKQVPRVMSPIDELRYLDLVNFRRLGTTPAEAVNKIASKIKLLEKDGYEKKIGGIMAWKQNPINKIYLKMGQEALIKGESLKDFTLKAQTAKTPGLLSWEEIELIIKLNNQFMF